MMHVQIPDRETEERDQRDFDKAVDRTGKTLLEWLAGVGILAALTMSIIALAQSSGGHPSSMVARSTPTPAAPAAAVAPAQAPSAVPTKTVTLEVIGGYKPGPDGKKHDAFTKTEFAVKVGQPLKLQINNTDDVPHSITAPVAGLNITIKPGTHTYTLVVTHAGRFQWFCITPCDTDANGWGMQNAGFMSGYITAT
jgi:hypothetical protein